MQVNGSRPHAIRHPVRVSLLDAVSDGKPLALADFAARTEIPLTTVEYHCRVLSAEGALAVLDGTATITEVGKGLHRLCQTPERRQADRRRGERRDD
jgi:Helix-turn-helix domain